MLCMCIMKDIQVVFPSQLNYTLIKKIWCTKVVKKKRYKEIPRYIAVNQNIAPMIVLRLRHHYIHV